MYLELRPPDLVELVDFLRDENPQPDAERCGLLQQLAARSAGAHPR